MPSNIFAQDGNIVTVGQCVPNFSFVDQSGKTVNMSELKGKVVLINFFATWCSPCRQELPFLQKDIFLKYKSNNDFRLVIFGRGHTLAEIQAFKEANKYIMPMYPDENKVVFNLFASQSIPRNYIIDRKGIVSYASIGYEPDEFQNMVTKLDILLKK